MPVNLKGVTVKPLNDDKPCEHSLEPLPCRAGDVFTFIPNDSDTVMLPSGLGFLQVSEHFSSFSESADSVRHDGGTRAVTASGIHGHFQHHPMAAVTGAVAAPRPA